MVLEILFGSSDLRPWLLYRKGLLTTFPLHFVDLYTWLHLMYLERRIGLWRHSMSFIPCMYYTFIFTAYSMLFACALHLERKYNSFIYFCLISLQQQVSTYPDLVAYQCIAVTLGKAGYLKELFDVIDSMRSPPKKFKTGVIGKCDPELEPDIMVYNAVSNTWLNSICKR